MTSPADRLWLAPIPAAFRPDAVAALDAGNVVGFLVAASNEDSLHLVWRNVAPLRARGLYEAALLEAYAATRTNNRQWPVRVLSELFACADRTRLRVCGDPLPGAGPFTLYRGVAGRGRARRVRGLSWTDDLVQARWYADRSGLLSLADPAVLQTTVEEAAVLAYVNARKEREFLVLLPPVARIVRVPERDAR